MPILRRINGELVLVSGGVSDNASLGQGYAVCSTAASTTAKVASITDYSLETGGIVSILFENDVPADATLNINSKGAKAIYYKDAAITDGIIKAGDTATLIYDGTRYRVISFDSVGGYAKAILNVICLDDSFIGKTVTAYKENAETVTATISPEKTATLELLNAGDYEITCNYVKTKVTILALNNIYSVTLNASWKLWAQSGGVTTTSYNSLSDLLADEKAVRQIMTIHASVDWLAETNIDDGLIETIVNDDICAKWISLRDYALDTLYANEDIASLMDESDKYFYGEWALMPQVPKMTSNTAPYGEASASSVYGNYPGWKVFDGVLSVGANATDHLWVSNSNSNEWISYHFQQQVEIKAVKIYGRTAQDAYINANLKTYKIQYSDNGQDWIDASPEYEASSNGINSEVYVANNSGKHEYWRIYCIDNWGFSYMSIVAVQFYAWQPKGNVPVMTSNSAPYGEVSASSVWNNDSRAQPCLVFDRDPSTRWCSNYGISSGWIQYKFVNPVSVRKISVLNSIEPHNVKAPKNIKILGSNDGTNFVEIIDYINSNNKSKGKWSISFNNKNYYLYYRFSIIENYNDGDAQIFLNIATLQFYGRELKVSVPKMTSNTEPWGEASASHTSPDNSNPPWKAFDKSTSALWSNAIASGAGVPEWLEYDFTQNIVCKMATVKPYSQANEIGNYKIQAFNESTNSWEDLASDTNSSTNEFIVSISGNSLVAKKHRLLIETTPSSNNYASCAELQFYGLDYSEYDWDTDNPRHYIYDHGVELEEITLAGTASKENQSLKLIAANDQVSKTLDTTNYTLLRGTVGQNASGTNVLLCGSGSASFVTANLPYNQTLDVSSINDNNATGVKQTAAGTFEVEEIWLE